MSPQLPRIVSDVGPRPVQESIPAAEAPGRSLAGLGEDVSAVAEHVAAQQLELNRSKRYMEAVSLASNSADQFYKDTVNAPPPSPDFIGPQQTLPDKINEGLTEIHDSISKDIKDPQVKLRFDQFFQGLRESHVSQAKVIDFNRTKDDYLAGVKSTLDNFTDLAGQSDGPTYANYAAQIVGVINNAVAHHAMTREEGQKELDSRFAQIQHAQAMQMIRDKPAMASKLLQEGTWEKIPPVQREQLINIADRQDNARKEDALRAQEKADREAAKAAEDARVKAYSDDYTLADQGKLTHEQLEADRQKFGFTGPESHVLFDAIDKPREDYPENKTLGNDVTIKIGQFPPTISQRELDQLQKPGGLNSSQHAKFSVMLANKLHALSKPESQTQLARTGAENLRANLGQDRDVYAQGLTEYNNKLAGGLSDPVAAANEITKRLQPLVSAHQSEFNTALKGYFSAAAKQRNWASTHYIKDFAGAENPNDTEVQQAQSLLLDRAKRSNRIYGLAQGAPDGTTKVLPDGRTIVTVGGYAILE